MVVEIVKQPSAAGAQARQRNAALPVVELFSVAKRYPNGTRALDPVDLVIHDGEFVTLIGPSGCGKSTLLKLLAGLTSPSTGQIRWWQGDFSEVGQPGRHLSMVFQDATLMPWARVAKNVRLPLDLAREDRAAGDRTVAAALALVGLEKFARHFPRELSGGMQMRVSIARALVTAPNLLLMDEPFGALDEITRNRLDAELADLWRKRALTVVFVTHSIYEAVFLSSRVIVLSARPGRVAHDVRIDAPFPRDDSFRVSHEFAAYAKELSERLAEASAESRPGA